MSEWLRSKEEIEKALKLAENAFDGFCMIADRLSKNGDPEYLRGTEDRAVGHGAIVHILQWVLGHHNDRGIDRVIITEITPGVCFVQVLSSSAEEDLQ